jgi:PAS domain S-box-containing protein
MKQNHNGDESIYRALVEAAPAAMVIVNRSGLIELVNAQAERMFGALRIDLIGQPVEVLLPARFRADHPASRHNFFAYPKARAMGAGRDLYARRHDGSEFPVEIGLNPIETAEGPMVLAAIVDITERKRLENRFQQVVESVPSGIVMVNRSGLIELVNAQAERMFGALRADLIGQPVEVLLPERFRADHPASRHNFFAHPKTRAMGAGRDLYARRRDGSEFPVEIGLNPIETTEGPMVLAAIVDITERKHAEQALRESEESFRLLVDGVKEYAIYMLDVDGHVMSWNVGAQNIKGYSADEVLGRSPDIFYTEDEVRSGLPGKHLRLAHDQGRFEGDVLQVRKDGSTFWANILLTALYDETGRHQGYSKVTRDITEHKRTQETISRALDEKTTLLNEVHHRVKNNLQVISSLFNLQALHTSDPDVKQVLAESQGRVRAMALIHQLLYECNDFTRIHLDNYLERLGQLLITLNAPASSRASVRTESEGFPVYLDLHRAIPCGLLVTELITNAFKHAFPDGRNGEVRISLSWDGRGEACLSICDNGVGLPENFCFEQSRSLGLKLVQRLAGQIEGRLERGRGSDTCFILYFTPIMEDDKT